MNRCAYEQKETISGREWICTKGEGHREGHRLAPKVVSAPAVSVPRAATSERGQITTQRTIWCGLCAEWDQVSDGKGIRQAWRRRGWKQTKAHGWVCPGCVRVRKDVG